MLVVRDDTEKAIQYAIENDRVSVTLVHKGNIMKFTEGAFRDWGYEVARDKFAEHVCTEADLGKAGTKARADAVVIKDRIADAMFQQLLLRPDEYSVIATPSLRLAAFRIRPTIPIGDHREGAVDCAGRVSHGAPCGEARNRLDVPAVPHQHCVATLLLGQTRGPTTAR